MRVEDDGETLGARSVALEPAALAVAEASSQFTALSLWLDAARREEPAYVLATVEDVRAVGISQYTRANH